MHFKRHAVLLLLHTPFAYAYIAIIICKTVALIGDKTTFVANGTPGLGSDNVRWYFQNDQNGNVVIAGLAGPFVNGFKFELNEF